MKLSHIGKSKYLSQYSLFPKKPKVILFGSPNNDLKYLAHRLAIDLNVPALSMKSIYKNILAYENSYSNESFYRKVISIFKNTNKAQALSALESEQIPEKLINLTKYSELGYVLYDYPLNLTQAQNLENTSGGMNIVLNLMLKRDAALARESSKYVCTNCEEVYFKDNLNFNNEIILEKNFPENSVCSNCGHHNIVKVEGTTCFNEQYENYEKKLLELGPFYNTLGILEHFEIKYGANDYNEIRDKVFRNIKV